MPALLPTYPQHPCFAYRVMLSKHIYRLTWTWLERPHWWLLDLALDDATKLATGMRVVVGTALPMHRNDERLPAGSIFAVDMSGQMKDLESREELGDRVKVFYAEPGQIPTAPSSSHNVIVRELT